MIEVELRSFVTREKFDELLGFFSRQGVSSPTDDQVTYYFDGPHDLRIQQNSQYAKVWLKKGRIHDDAREEIEVRVPRDDFHTLEKLFLALGYSVSIKWFRTRRSFEWEGITVCLDHTKGYGYIIEFEKLCEENQKDDALAYLQERCATLDISISPREEFEERFNHYKEHWRSLVESN